MNEKIKPEDISEKGAITSGEEIDIEGEEDEQKEVLGVDEMRSQIDRLKVDYADEYVQKMKVDQYGEDELPLWRKYRTSVKSGWKNFAIPEFNRKLDVYKTMLDQLAQQKGHREEVESKRNLLQFFRSELEQAQEVAQAA